MWRKISKEAAIEVAKEIVKYSFWLAIPPLIGLLGWLQKVPLFYVLVGIILSGAGIMTWLVQFDEWRIRNRVEHKLAFASMKIHGTVTEDRIVAVKFGFFVRNLAAFPITFRIDSIQTSLKVTGRNEEIYPSSKPHKKNDFTISPGGIGWFDDHNIILPNGYQGDAIAEINCKVSYGKATRLDFELEFNKNTHLNFTGSVISGGQHWYDL